MKTTFKIEELNLVAKKLLETATNKTLLFYGDVGVGKTTLIKEIAKQLGVTETISSPTFSIVNEYVGSNDIIYHFDFYRLNSEEEALDIGIEEYFYSGHWNLIEWPDNIKSLLPEKSTIINLITNPDGSRTLNITPLE